MASVFITASGTDVGKTFVAAGLIRYLRASGETIDAVKPIVSGFDPARAGESDSGVLLRALGLPAHRRGDRGHLALAFLGSTLPRHGCAA